MDKAWMVFKDGKHGRKPRVMHASITSAMEEAVRLARKEPSIKFVVVEVIGSVQCNDGILTMTEAV